MIFYKNAILKRSNRLLACIITTISTVFIAVLMSCSRGYHEEAGYYQTQTPKIYDFEITGLGTYDFNGLAREVRITPKTGKSNGKITISYEKGFASSKRAPSSVGSYRVTFDVEAADGWDAVDNLYAGDITISARNTAIQLTADTWANGNIAASGGEQWFKFTATAATQYIHFNPGSLQDVYIQLYDNAGSTLGNQANLYSDNYLSRTVTSGNEYYIKVTPYSKNSGGTYKIGINTSSTPPSP